MLKDLDLTNEKSFVRFMAMFSCLVTKMKEKELISEEDHLDIYREAAQVIRMAEDQKLFD